MLLWRHPFEHVRYGLCVYIGENFEDVSVYQRYEATRN